MSSQITVRLRAHHLLCIRFFAGHGYSEAFAKNMRCVIDALKSGALVTLTQGLDDICSSCPNVVQSAFCFGGEGEGECSSEEKVLSYDKAVLSALKDAGLDTLVPHSWEELYNAVTECIMMPKDGIRLFDTICPTCQWRDFCG